MALVELTVSVCVEWHVPLMQFTIPLSSEKITFFFFIALIRIMKSDEMLEHCRCRKCRCTLIHTTVCRLNAREYISLELYSIQFTFRHFFFCSLFFRQLHSDLAAVDSLERCNIVRGRENLRQNRMNFIQKNRPKCCHRYSSWSWQKQREKCD